MSEKHYHRRSAKARDVGREVRLYTCTEQGCDWLLYVLPGHREMRTYRQYLGVLPEEVEAALDQRPTSLVQQRT